MCRRTTGSGRRLLAVACRSRAGRATVAAACACVARRDGDVLPSMALQIRKGERSQRRAQVARAEKDAVPGQVAGGRKNFPQIRATKRLRGLTNSTIRRRLQSDSDSPRRYECRLCKARTPIRSMLEPSCCNRAVLLWSAYAVDTAAGCAKLQLHAGSTRMFTGRAVPCRDGDAAISEAQTKRTGQPEARACPDGLTAIAQPSMQIVAGLSTDFNKILSTDVDNSTRAA